MEKLDLENENEQNILDGLKQLQKTLETNSLNSIYPGIYSNPRFYQVIRIMQKPACILVFAYYPKFKKDLIKLLVFGYIDETETGLEWKKSDKSLAEYFGNQVDKDENRRWAEVENLFRKKWLADSYRNAKQKSSKDYRELFKLLKENPPKDG